MYIRLTNVGLVRSAAVDTRDLTVVMGPNNSGKSTIAATIYAAIKASSAFRDSRRVGSGFVLNRDGVRQIPHSPSKSAIQMAEVSLRQAGSRQSLESATREVSRAVSVEVLGAFGKTFTTELEAALAAPLTAIATRDLRGRRLPLKIVLSSERQAWSIEIRVRGKSFSVDVDLGEAPVSGADDLALQLRDALQDKRGSEAFTGYLIRQWGNRIGEILLDELPARAHYLPAARAGLLQSHRLVAAAMFQRTPMFGISEVSMPALSGVVADFVSEILLSPPRPRRRNASLQSLATEIEVDVLHGKVRHVDTGNGYPEIEFSDHAGEYPVHRTSSMVSELAPIVLLLRRTLEPGDLLIIEEPESHLHPESQTRLASILFRASRYVKVILTTHSDFFLSQINNEIRRMLLSSNDSHRVDVAAYWVDRDDEGSHLIGLGIDPVDGIPEESFMDVASSLYDEQIKQQISIQNATDR